MTEAERKKRVADAIASAQFWSRSVDPAFRSLAEDVQWLAAQLTDAENTIRDFAWRADCWSEQDIIAHVADYFRTTVAEVESQMERARSGG